MSILGIGTSSTVYLIDKGKAEKRFESPEDLFNEGNIYRALGSHPRLLSIHHIGPSSIIMDRMKNGNLARYLQSHREITQRRRHQWISQIAECFYLLHTHQISHCDSKLENFLLDDNYDIKICDFASSHNWKALSKDLAIQPVRYRRPLVDFDGAVFNPADDIFAFGSICYEIVTSGPPYLELDDEKVKLQFSQGSFPKTNHFRLGHVMRSCWKGHFISFEAILSTIQQENSSSVDR